MEDDGEGLEVMRGVWNERLGGMEGLGGMVADEPWTIPRPGMSGRRTCQAFVCPGSLLGSMSGSRT